MKNNEVTPANVKAAAEELHKFDVDCHERNTRISEREFQDILRKHIRDTPKPTETQMDTEERADSKELEPDLNCWGCQVPLIVKLSREAYIKEGGYSATYCENPQCQVAADAEDKRYGVPPVEIIRRKNNGIRPVRNNKKEIAKYLSSLPAPQEAPKVEGDVEELISTLKYFSQVQANTDSSRELAKQAASTIETLSAKNERLLKGFDNSSSLNIKLAQENIDLEKALAKAEAKEKEDAPI